MTRSSEVNERIREETYNKIIDTAVGLFARKGYAATSMQDIANKAGISVGLIYRHFATKQALFEDIISFAVGGMAGFGEILLAMPPKDAIYCLVSSMLEDIDKNSDSLAMSMLMTQGVMSSDNSMYASLLNEDLKLITTIAQLIENGQVLGVFKAGKPLALSYLIVSAIQGLMMMKWVFDEKFEMPAIDDVLGFLIK